MDGGADGTYTLAYNFTDAEGRSAETVFRTITVVDNVPPFLHSMASQRLPSSVIRTLTREASAEDALMVSSLLIVPSMNGISFMLEATC